MEQRAVAFACTHIHICTYAHTTHSIHARQTTHAVIYAVIQPSRLNGYPSRNALATHVFSLSGSSEQLRAVAQPPLAWSNAHLPLLVHMCALKYTYSFIHCYQLRIHTVGKILRTDGILVSCLGPVPCPFPVHQETTYAEVARCAPDGSPARAGRPTWNRDRLTKSFDKII